MSILNKNKFKKLHLIGIFGTGMSSLALFLNSLGFYITGSDISLEKDFFFLKQGIKIYDGHFYSNLYNVNFIIYSSGIKLFNKEIQYCLINNIFFFSRSFFISIFLRKKIIFFIMGSHGKTTISSFFSFSFNKLLLCPNFLIGDILLNSNKRSSLGSSLFLVFESDESDKNIFFFIPFFLFISNIDREHLSKFSNSLFFLVLKFSKILFNLSSNNFIFFFLDSKYILSIISKKNISFLFFSKSGFSFFLFRNNFIINGLNFFSFLSKEYLFSLFLNILGSYNIINCIFIIIFLFFFFNFKINNLLFVFKGAKNRLEKVFKNENICLINDYAHHPTELKSVINILSILYFNYFKIIIFQPHRISRISILLNDFSDSFTNIEIIFITNIYSASEFINNSLVYFYLLLIFKKEKKSKFFFFLKLKILIKKIFFYLKKKTLLVFIGAGTIKKYFFLFLKKKIIK